MSATKQQQHFSVSSFTGFIICAVLALVGCGRLVAASPSPVPVTVLVSGPQGSVRVGGTASLPLTYAGISLAGTKWVVVGGSSFGTVNSAGLYQAPIQVPALGVAILQCSFKNLLLTTSISILNPVPSVTSVMPEVLRAALTPVVVTGSSFVKGSQIVMNGLAVATTFIDAEHLSGSLALVTPVGNTAQIVVRNPNPGAVLSSGLGIQSALPLVPPAVPQPLLPLATLHTPSYFMEQSDEFVGPFPSWTNVKTTFGAVGDGVADDTVAIQNAINSLTVDSASCVLWLPAGTYKITKTLVFGHKAAFSLIGEDPTSTTLKWAGVQGGTMLQTDGSTTSKISRLELDGSGIADIAEDFTSITPYENAYYSTFNEISDQHIRGVKLGLNLEVDAETTIERVFFDHLATAGLAVGNYNTLNIFVNDSLFESCGTGLTDAFLNGSGSFIVSNSYFHNSQVADMSIANTGLFTARHNTSVGAKTFFLAYEIYDNNSTITLQNNTVLDPLTTPFQFGNLGPFMLIDNVVRLQDKTIPMIEASWTAETALKDVFSMGNVYTANGGDGTGDLPFQGRISSYDDSVVPLDTIADVTIPTNVYIPPNFHRPIFEVGAKTGTAVQTAINLAVSANTQRPVVHLPKGNYAVTSSISLPAGSDVQLVGDDTWSSALVWNGASLGPVLAISTSNVSVRNLHITGAGQGKNDGILLKLADEPNMQVIVDQAALESNNAFGVNFDGMEHATNELFSTYANGSVTSVRVAGGPFRSAKEGTLGITNYYTGSIQSEGTGTSFDVSAGGKFMVQDDWHDYDATSPENFKLSGSGTVTEQGGGVFMSSNTPFEIDNFSGNVTLMGLSFANGFLLNSTAGQANLLNLGLVGTTEDYLPSSTTNITVGDVLNSYRGGHIVQGATPAATWMRNMLAQTRSEYPIARPSLSLGSSRIRLNRVTVDSTSSAVHFMPDTARSGLYYELTSGLSNLVSTSGSCVSTTFLKANDQWLIMAAGDGDFEIVSKQTGSVLGFAASPTQALVLEAVTGLYDQRWLISNLGDGTFSLMNRQTGTLLSLPAQGGCAGIATGGSTSWTMTAH